MILSTKLCVTVLPIILSENGAIALMVYDLTVFNSVLGVDVKITKPLLS